MINILKNNYFRLKSKKYYSIIYLIMTILSIVAAVYMTSKFQTKGNIAFVTNDKEKVIKSEYFNFVSLEREPEKYELALGRYDGIVIDNGAGEYEIYTIKNTEYKQMLKNVMDNPDSKEIEIESNRGVGTNIIGFLMVFILLQSILFMFTLAEEIELKQIERIAVSPLSFFKYILAHFIFNISFIVVPTFLTLTIINIFFKVNIGFSLTQYLGLLILLGTLGTSFSLFINAFIKGADNANMIGSASVLLTTILSGSFYSFENGNKILQKILLIFPQKEFLNFVKALEDGKNILNSLPQILYVIIISLVFFFISIVKIKKDYVLRRE